MSKTKKGAQISASHLNLFRALHAELDAAHERAAHEATRARMQVLEHEVAAMRLSAGHNAAVRQAQARTAEREADVAAAKTAARGLAEQLARDYALDLRTHAICPTTGAITRLDGDARG